MNLVKNKKDILINIELLDSYINRGQQQEKEFAISLIKRGTCFLAVAKDNTYEFYPSRFIGYAYNNMDAHLNNENKDGRVTNPAISDILGHMPSFNIELEKEYRRYCEVLGFTAKEKGTFGVERKYWLLVI